MSTERSLGTLLRALHDCSDKQDISRLLASATTLLTLLGNPLNVTLLTSKLLSSPSIWTYANSLQTPAQILSIFSAATVRKIHQDGLDPDASSMFPARKLALEEWVIAVYQGADEHSPRWRHLCALAGLILGLKDHAKQPRLQSLSQMLESAIIKAVNLALLDDGTRTEMSADSIAMILCRTFDTLCGVEKWTMEHDRLLPVLCQAMFFSGEGLRSGYFLSTIDADIAQTAEMKFEWSHKSSSFLKFQAMVTGPLIAALGPLSRVIACSVETVRQMDLLAAMIKNLSDFTRSLHVQWRQNKLSEIDITEEAKYLSDDTMNTTLPTLWNNLRSIVFAVTIILRALLGRVLSDSRIAATEAPFIAIETLQILHDLYFITSRFGISNFSQYSFVYLAALDIVSQYPDQAEQFALGLRPSSIGKIPQHPLDRSHNLFFFNTCEHLTLVLPTAISENLLIGASAPYLRSGNDLRLLDSFEAAHSLVLAIFSAPQNAALLPNQIHPYLQALLESFPQAISSRQFRLAIRTLISITSPPHNIAENNPLLPLSILELLQLRLEKEATATKTLPLGPGTDHSIENASTSSELSTIVLAMVDALPLLPTQQLEALLPVIASSLGVIENSSQVQICKQRFWEILTNGEMGVSRAAICLEWWTSRGGRESVMGPGAASMSGALVEDSKL